MDYYGDKEVDHIDGNSLNNRKYNLRIIDRQSNCLNMQCKINNTSGIRGVSFDKRYKSYTVDCTCKKQRLYLKPMKKLEEAVYLRYLCEIYLFKEFRNESNDENYNHYISILSQEQKDNIRNYLESKLKIKNIMED